MEIQNDPSETSSQSTTPQSSNPLPRRSPDQIGTKADSFLTNKLFLITVAILILFAIVYSGIYLSLNSKSNQITKSNQTPTTPPSASPAPGGTGRYIPPNGDRANWKTFNSADKSFSFQYPKEWQDPSMSSLSTRTSYLFSSNMTVEVGLHYNQALNRSLSYEEELKEIQKYAISSKDITVAGIQTKEYIQKMTSIYTGGMVILKGKDPRDIIWISIPFYKETDQNTFDQILSTFRFTQ